MIVVEIFAGTLNTVLICMMVTLLLNFLIRPVLWTNFRPGFPVSNSSRNCLLYSCDRSYPFQFWDYGCEVAIRYVCEELAGNSDCGVPDTYMVEESFKTADVESCRSICKSISTCTFFTFSGGTR